MAYYHNGHEEREVARHLRTGKRLEATEDNRQNAERFLKHKVGENIAERQGGPTFVAPAHQRLTVNDLFDALQREDPSSSAYVYAQCKKMQELLNNA